MNTTRHEYHHHYDDDDDDDVQLKPPVHIALLLKQYNRGVRGSGNQVATDQSINQ